MKRYGNIYEKIYDIENLREAHRKAKRDKSYYREVKEVESNPDYYLYKIQDMLKNKTYKVGKYKVKNIIDGGKERELYILPYYPDRIIQWAIMLQTEPIFTDAIPYHSCASLPNRGIKRAFNLTKKYAHDKTHGRYCLKMDIKKFYPSIDKEILKGLLRKKFKDRDLLDLIDLIIDSYPKDKGLPIGSYLSQYLANFYLVGLDNYLKHTEKARCVVRYMDDVIVFHSSKLWLHEVRKRVERYLGEFLNLKLKENWQIFPVEKRGVDFVGYRFFKDYVLLRKRTAVRFKRKMRWLRDNRITYRDYCSANSYRGFLMFADCFRLYEKFLKPLEDKLREFYINRLRRAKYA